ncbi:MAG: ABATE domain-containing protein [Anaerolineales bacterium]
MTEALDEFHFDFEAGRLSLDFANTAEWHASENPTEHIGSYGDLVVWGKQARLLSAGQANTLRAKAEKSPTKAERVLRDALALREAIYRIFSSMADGARPDASDLDLLAENLKRAIAEGELTTEGESYGWKWPADDLSLGKMLWPVASDAVDLLRSDDVGRVGECADDRGCGWLFLDTSRNHSRRWCSMESCGNRAKARRHYERVKAESGD